MSDLSRDKMENGYDFILNLLLLSKNFMFDVLSYCAYSWRFVWIFKIDVTVSESDSGNERWWSFCYAKCLVRSICKELWCYYYQLHRNTHQLCSDVLYVPCQCVSTRVSSTQPNHIISLYFAPKKVKMFLIIRKFLSPVPLGRQPQGSIELFFLSLRPFLFQVQQKTASLILQYNNIIIFQ